MRPSVQVEAACWPCGQSKGPVVARGVASQWVDSLVDMRMSVSGTMRRAVASCGLTIAMLAALAPGAGAGGSIGPSSAPPTIAYVTQTASSQPVVWTIRTDGSQNTRIGPGFTPLISPSAGQVAASLFGASTTGTETGPALAIYST